MTFWICSDRPQAQHLYDKWSSDPINMFHTWDVRNAMSQHPKDKLYFLYNPYAMLPLQITAEGVIEWFGGWLIEDQAWWGDQYYIKQMLDFIRGESNALDCASSPVDGYTELSCIRTCQLRFSSLDQWYNKALSKKRRYEIRQVLKETVVETTYDVTVAKALNCLELLRSLLEASFEDRDFFNMHLVPSQRCHLEELLKWSASNASVDVAIRRLNGSPVSVTIGIKDPIVPVYHWVFGSTKSDTDFSSLGKILIYDVVSIADSRNIHTINGFGDLIRRESYKLLMGFTTYDQWSLKTSINQ